MIPAERIHPRAMSSLMEYLRFEIFRAENERKPLEEKWIKWHRGYKCVPEFQTKEFPFYGAANLVLPVIATDVDIIFSRLMGLLFAPSNLWTARPLRPDMVQYASRVQEFMEWAQHHELNAYNSIADWLLELCKLGTGVLKQRYRREQKRVYHFRETPMGTIEDFMQVMTHDHPQIDHVSLYDFLVPSESMSIEDAPWVGERVRLSWPQVMNRARNGIYTGLDRLQSWDAHDKGSLVLQHLQAMDRYQPGLSNKFDLWEIWLDYDISGIGEPQSLVCTVHLPSMTYLRVDYNPFFNQEIPFSTARYLRQEKRFYGIGLAEILEQFQDEVTTIHNQRLDNATLANSTLYKAKRGSGIREDEPVFPGRWFLVEEMDDVATMPMGQKYDSTVQYEAFTMQYATKRSGANEFISGGFEPGIGYSTATVGVQQLRESAKRFDQTMREVRVALSETGQRCLELYQQFNQGGKPFVALGEADGQMVDQVLHFPMELIRMSIGVELTATSASFNKEVEIRINSILMQQVQQYYMQAMQAVSYYMNPQLPPMVRQLALQMAVSGSILLRRILDSYGIQDADRLVPELEAALNGGQQQLNILGSLAAGGAPGAFAAGQQPGVAGLLPAGNGSNAASPVAAGNGAGLGYAA